MSGARVMGDPDMLKLIEVIPSHGRNLFKQPHMGIACRLLGISLGGLSFLITVNSTANSSWADTRSAAEVAAFTSANASSIWR